MSISHRLDATDAVKLPFASVKAKVSVLLSDWMNSCKPGIPLLVKTSLTFPEIVRVGAVKVRLCVSTWPEFSVTIGATLKSETYPGLAASTTHPLDAAFKE